MSDIRRGPLNIYKHRRRCYAGTSPRLTSLLYLLTTHSQINMPTEIIIPRRHRHRRHSSVGYRALSELHIHPQERLTHP